LVLAPEFAYLLDRQGREIRVYDLAVVRPSSLAFDILRILPWGKGDDP